MALILKRRNGSVCLSIDGWMERDEWSECGKKITAILRVERERAVLKAKSRIYLTIKLILARSHD